jgi:hypothetical protein
VRRCPSRRKGVPEWPAPRCHEHALLVDSLFDVPAVALPDVAGHSRIRALGRRGHLVPVARDSFRPVTCPPACAGGDGTHVTRLQGGNEATTAPELCMLARTIAHGAGDREYSGRALTG